MKDDFPDNPVNEDSSKDSDFTPEDIKTSFGTHARTSEGEDSEGLTTRRRKAEWHETTDSPEAEDGDNVTNILTDEPEFPEDGNMPPPPPPPSPPSGGSGGPPPPPQNPVSNYIRIERKNGQPPKDKVLMKALDKAIEQGWDKIYVFKKNERTPDIEVARYIQSFIEKNNLSGKISCCCDPAGYKSAGTARKIHKNNLRNGATRGKNMEFK